MIDYSLFTYSKGTPRVIAKLHRDREAARVERACRAQVDARDGRRCFFPGCRQHASDKHHILRRSAGGQWATRNILSACRRHHDWFKAGLITTTGNPDRGPVTVQLTALGREAQIRVQTVAGDPPGRGRR
jgi:hypothetical protein